MLILYYIINGGQTRGQKGYNARHCRKTGDKRCFGLKGFFGPKRSQQRAEAENYKNRRYNGLPLRRGVTQKEKSQRKHRRYRCGEIYVRQFVLF